MLKLNELLKKREKDNSYYYPATHDDLGYVSLGQGRVRTWACREGFHSAFNIKTGHMIFRGSRQNATELIRKVEDRVGVSRKNAARFLATDNAQWIEVLPGWWIDDLMRFSLFTILLRASRTHTTIEGAMKYTYLRSTKLAFKSFLAGKTRFLGTATSWYGWGYSMGAKKAGPLCLISDSDMVELEQAKKNKKMVAIAKKLRQLGENRCKEEAILYQLTKAII